MDTTNRLQFKKKNIIIIFTSVFSLNYFYRFYYYLKILFLELVFCVMVVCELNIHVQLYILLKKRNKKKKVQLYMMIVVPCRVEPQQKIICLVRGQTIYLVWLELCLSWFEVYWYSGPQTPDSADFSASVQTFNLQFIWFGWSCNVPLVIWGLLV